MTIESVGAMLRVSQMDELSAAKSTWFRDQVRAALRDQHLAIEIDFCGLDFVDSCGLGALVAIHKALCGRNGLVRILNPSRAVRQLFERSHLDRIFLVV